MDVKIVSSWDEMRRLFLSWLAGLSSIDTSKLLIFKPTEMLAFFAEENPSVMVKVRFVKSYEECFKLIAESIANSNQSPCTLTFDSESAFSLCIGKNQEGTTFIIFPITKLTGKRMKSVRETAEIDAVSV